MVDQYAGVLALDRIPKAKETLAELEQRLASQVFVGPLRNSCGSANRRMAIRLRLLKEQILRSEVKDGE